MSKQDKAQRKRKFLEELIDNGGHVAAACAKLRMARSTLARYRDEDDVFATAWNETIEQCVEDLESEVRRRALGYEEPIVYQGKVQGRWANADGDTVPETEPGAVWVAATVTKYSDMLLMFLLKGHRPEKYREGPGAKKGSELSDSELDAAIQRMIAKKAKSDLPPEQSNAIN